MNSLRLHELRNTLDDLKKQSEEKTSEIETVRKEMAGCDGKQKLKWFEYVVCTSVYVCVCVRVRARVCVYVCVCVYMHAFNINLHEQNVFHSFAVCEVFYCITLVLITPRAYARGKEIGLCGFVCHRHCHRPSSPQKLPV